MSTVKISPKSTSRHLPFVLNPDGSFHRIAVFSDVAADPTSPSPVLTRDAPLSPHHNTWIRLFLPQAVLNQNPTTKLPLIVYFHGGGFVMCSAANTFFHQFCADMALQVPAIVASVEYRLAPEHRLPAAYNDAVDALMWIRSSTDEWIAGFSDLSNCFLMGTSAGGNIAYHGGLLAAESKDNLSPLKIRGLILNQPYFGGSDTTPSELRLLNCEGIPLSLNHEMWELSLPIGCDRDHKYSNPTVDDHSLDLIKSLGWIVMVTGCEGDPLIDRQRELAKVLMEKKGVPVVGLFEEMGFHGWDLMDGERAKRLFQGLAKLVATTDHRPISSS